VLNAVDAAALEAALHAWALAHLELMGPPPGTPRREQRRVLALDGKTVRGARVATTSDSGERGGESALVSRPHLVSVLDEASGVVLAQIQVEAKGSEVGVFQTLLDEFDLTDVLITADALHTHRGHADYLHERGGHYLMTVKANQPTYGGCARCRGRRSVPAPGNEPAVTAAPRLARSAWSACIHADQSGDWFPHAAQAIKLVRRRRPLRPGGKWKTVAVYAITSLTSFDIDSALLADWIRGHWSIENRLHWVRDVVFDEDRSQARTGTGPHVMAALLNLAITALRLSGTTNIAAALRHHARDPQRPLTPGNS
jgi:predicted transposase YbfD/YdcC